jgi:SEC-C motif-containing protein
MARGAKAGRNDPCPCGSGKKYKRCCEATQRRGQNSRVMVFVVLAILTVAIGAAITSLGEDASPVAAPGRVWSPEHGHYH